MPSARVFWRLTYPDGHKEQDLTGTHDIRTASVGATELQVLNYQARPLIRVPLAVSNGERPVFYRVDDTTVFGRVNKAGGETYRKRRTTTTTLPELDGALWACIDSKIVNCPDDPTFIDRELVSAQHSSPPDSSASPPSPTPSANPTPPASTTSPDE